MNQNYNDLIEQISHLLVKTIVEEDPNLAEKVHQLILLTNLTNTNRAIANKKNLMAHPRSK